MHEDYAFPVPDVRTELAVLLDDARRLLKAYWAKDDHAYGEHYADYEADRLQLTLHNLFGDAIPAPKPAPVPVAVTVPTLPAPPVHSPRRVLALAS